MPDTLLNTAANDSDMIEITNEILFSQHASTTYTYIIFIS